MHFLKTYFDTIIAYDLINKFFYSNIRKLPCFTKVVLCLTRKNSNLRDLISMILFFEILSNNKITTNNIIRYRKSNVFIKIKKGSPMGCKVVLRKNKVCDVFEFLYTDILTNEKNCKHAVVASSNSLSLRVTNPMKIKELDRNFYSLFKNLPWLSITFFTTTETKEELNYLLKAYKLKNFINCICNSINW